MEEIFFPVCIFLAGGIFFSGKTELWDIILLTLCVFSSALFLKKLFNIGTRYRFLLMSVFFIGAFLGKYAMSPETKKIDEFSGKFITAAGYVYDIPNETNGRFSYVIMTDGAEYMGKILKTKEKLLLSSDIRLDYGEEVYIRGFLDEIKGKMNSSDFDYRMYYKSRHIFYRISGYEVKTEGNIRTSFSLRFIAGSYKNKILKYIDDNFSGDEAALLKVIFAGYKKDLSDELSDALYGTNTMRCLYPPYIHICIIIFIVGIITAVFKKNIRTFAVVLVILLYAVFNSSSPAVFKYAAGAIVGIVMRRKRGFFWFPDALGITAGVVLLFDPLLVYDAGFMVSAGAGWLFYALRPPVSALFSGIKNRRIRRFLVIFLISSAGIAPLSFYYFGNAALLSPLFSVILLPLSVMISVVFPAAMAERALLSAPLIFSFLRDTLLGFYTVLPVIFQKLPLSRIQAARPDIITLLAYFLAVSAIRRFYIRGKKDGYAKTVAAVLCIFAAVSAAGKIYHINDARITFINVGQGDCALIEFPSGANVLIDGGGSEEYSDYDVGEKIVVPYLKSHGIFRIDLAVITHFHKDHCGGVLSVMRKMNVGTVLYPDQMKDSEYRKEMQRIADEKGIKTLSLAAGDTLCFSKEERIEIYSPYDEEYAEENDTSIVCRTEFWGFSALFCGDATANAERRMLDVIPKTDLIKVGHHGSSTSSSEEFIGKTDPAFAVVSVGEDNSFGLPDENVLNRYRKNGSFIMRTDISGDIVFNVSKSGRVRVEAFGKDQ